MIERHTQAIKPGYGRKQPTLLLGGEHRGEVLAGILEEAQTLGWRLADMTFTKKTVPSVYSVVGAIVDKPVDSPDIAWVRQLSCPVVRTGILPHPLDIQFPAVISDYRSGGILAAEHFAERLFKHVAFVGSDPWGNAKSMWEGFQHRSGELGCECHLFRLKPSAGESIQNRFERQTRDLGQWLDGMTKPLGILAPDIWRGAGLTAMCHDLGVQVPEEVAVLSGLEVYLRCETTPVGLSAVDLGDRTKGVEAVRLLHRLIHGEPSPTVALRIPPVGVIERRSTNVLAVSDPVVGEAIRYIWDHLDLQVSVDHIAGQVGVSRSTLDHAFQRCLGRGVNAERLRKRLEYCAQLLRGTEMTIADVARASGFPSPSHLYRSFKQTFSMTPRQYRKTKLVS